MAGLRHRAPRHRGGRQVLEPGRSSRVAVSGHRNLPAGTVYLVDQAIRAALSDSAADVTGLSCLADGVDQIFARAVLDLGGEIEAVIAAEKYRDGPSRGYGGTADVVAHARECGMQIRVIWPDGAQRD